jgi:hypothetical protein
VIAIKPLDVIMACKKISQPKTAAHGATARVQSHRSAQAGTAVADCDSGREPQHLASNVQKRYRMLWLLIQRATAGQTQAFFQGLVHLSA